MPKPTSDLERFLAEDFSGAPDAWAALVLAAAVLLIAVVV